MSRFRKGFLITAPLLWALMMSPAFAEELAPDALIKAVSTEVIAAIRQDPAIQAGDPRKIAELVEAKIVPHFDLRRATQTAVGARWRRTPPPQQGRLGERLRTRVVRPCPCGKAPDGDASRA